MIRTLDVSHIEAVPNTHSVQGKYGRVRTQCSKEQQHRTEKNDVSPTGKELFSSFRDPGKRETWGVRESRRKPERARERTGERVREREPEGHPPHSAC